MIEKSNKKVIVVPYDPSWATTFKALQTIYQNHLGDSIVAIEHVGSTSVVGLAAKPIVDMDIIVEDKIKLKEVLQKMPALGYYHDGDYGIVGREVLKQTDYTVPFTATKKNWGKHNLYVCIQGVASLENHLRFRNYLRQHPAKVKEYAALKLELAQRFPYNIDQYIEHKTPFITNILAQTGFNTQTLNDITEQNRVK